MAKRIKYEVRGIEPETAKFSNLRHALLFACARSEERFDGTCIYVTAADGIACQYVGDKPTPELKQHHINGVFH